MWTSLSLAVAAASAAPHGQQTQVQEVPQAQQETSTGDVVVNGERLETRSEAKGVGGRDGGQALAESEAYSKSDIFVRCLQDIPAEVIREIIDGPPNRADTRYAQGELVSTNVACHLGMYQAPMMVVTAGASPMDRGALLQQVFETYAPDVSLTRMQTSDPAVQQRFNAREVPRNRWRQKVDFLHFSVAVCMVRMEPGLTVALVDAKPGSDYAGAIVRTIVDRARVCVGDAKRVKYGQISLRFRLLDALYRWVEAARDVPTLISDKPFNVG